MPPQWNTYASSCENGDLGRITNVRAVFFNGYASEPKGALSWRLVRDLAGSGALGDLLSHVIDLVQYLLGPISEVTALTSTVYTERPILPMGSGTHFAVIEDGELGSVENDDYAAALVRFAPDSRAAGAVGTLEASRVIVGPQCGIGFEIYGTEGSATWNFEQMNELRHLPGSRLARTSATPPCSATPTSATMHTFSRSGHQHGPRRSQGHRGEEVPPRGDRRRAL
jgi:predicted dehydrogenase